MKTNHDRPEVLEVIDLNQVRAVLKQRQKALLARIDAEAVSEMTSGPGPEERNDVQDAGDGAVATLAEDDRLADVQRASDELRLVEDALGRLDAGTYGRCIVDGGPIEPRRLRALPEALRCERHQAEYERQHLGGQHHPTL